jgi:hypothetical protein
LIPDPDPQQVAKIEILIKLFLENVKYNCLKLSYFVLNIRLLFPDLFRIRIRPKVSDPSGSGTLAESLNKSFLLKEVTNEK